MSRKARTDVFSRAKRSEVMSRILGQDTKPELRLRYALFALRLRYRLHVSSVPGRPDLVFPRYRAVVFVNGCFWHGHLCHLFKWPKSNRAFWRTKITGNTHRDKNVRRELTAAGWRSLTVWECSMRGARARRIPVLAERVARWIVAGATG